MPTTSGWPLSSETLRLPSVLSVTVTETWDETLSISWSRLSTRAEVLVPSELAEAICWFSVAMPISDWFSCGRIALCCWNTEVSWLAVTLKMLLNCCDMESAAVTTCWRSGVEVGSPAAAFRAEKKLSTPKLRLDLSSLITVSIWVR